MNPIDSSSSPVKPAAIPGRFIAVYFLILLAFMAGGAWFYAVQRNSVRDETERDLLAIAELKIGQISAWRSERLHDAAILEDLFLDSQTIQWLENPTRSSSKPILDRMRILEKRLPYSDILLIDTGGTILLSLTGRAGPVHPDAIPAVRMAFSTRKSQLTDLHASPDDSIPHLDVVIPLFSQNASPVGAVLLSSRADAFLFPLVQSWPTSSATAETLLIRKDGDSVLFLNELRHQKDTALKLRIPLTQTEVPAVRAVLGTEGLWEGLDYRGARVISVLKPVPDSSWLMVAKIDWDEAFAGWRFRSTLILSLIGVILLALSSVFGVLWQRRARSHFQALYRLELAGRESELRYHTTLMSIGDAVIVTDIDSRVTLLNPVAEELTGWPLTEARDKPLSEVFQIFHEKTRQPVEDPVSIVLREGKIVLLANHTVLVARNGIERPIADAGSPIRDETGKIIGVVLVFRDQTRERKAEEALRDSEARLKLAQSSSGAGMWDWDMATGRLEWSVELFHLFGLDPATTVASFDTWRNAIHPDDRVLAEKKIDEAIQFHASLNSEYRIVLASGEVRWVNSLGNTTYDEVDIPQRMSGICIDITERKQIEESLRESEERIQMALKLSRSFTFEWEPASDRVLRSASCGPILGLAGDEMEHDTGQSFFQRVHPEDRDRFLAILGALKPGAETYRTEYRLTRGNDAPAMLEEVGRGIFDTQGVLRRLIGVTTDITERKKAEEDLRESERQVRRANELLETVTRGTGVIIATVDTDLRYTYFNPTYQDEIRRLTGKELHLGMGMAELFSDMPEQLQIVLEEWSAPLRGESTNRSLEFGDPGRHRKVYRIFHTPLMNAEGRIVGAGEVAMDITEQAQAEIALRQSREDLDRAQAVGNVGSWRLDTRRNILTWSPETHRIFGIPEGTSLTYETFLSAIHPEDREYVDTQWKAGLQGEPYDVEHRLLVNGRIKWVREKAYLEFNDEGEMIGGFGITQDITPRKEMELELRQARDLLEKRVQDRTRDLMRTTEALRSEIRERIAAEATVKAERQRLYEVFETLPVYVILLTQDYHVTFANRFFEDRFGKSEGRRCYEYLFHRTEPCETCETYTVFKSGQPHHWEWAGPDGRVYDISDFPFTDTDGSPLIMEMGIDITEQKRSREALQQTSLYARSLIEASLDPLVTISPDGKITDVNQATELVTGVPREELIGSDFSDYFTEPQKAREGYQKVISEGFVKDYPLTIQHQSGKTTDVLYHATVYRNEAGQVQGVFAAARDVTERKAAQEKQNVTNSLLELYAKKTSRNEYLDAVVKVLRDCSGCTGAGIRLVQADGRIPFEASIGLDEEFLAKESEISIHRDACICIRIVAQQPDSRESPFMTLKGSFQCPNTLDFVEGLSETEKSRYRGVCPGCGYATVIVIPIRYRGRMMGAIHLSDPQPGKVSPETVEFLENMALLVGEALHRFETELLLRASESRLIEAQRIAHLGNWEWDLVGNELWWSEELYQIYGVSREDFPLSFDRVLEYIHPQDRERIEQAAENARTHGRPFSLDHRIVRGDGSERILHIEAEIACEDSGKPVRILGTVQDVTEQERIEEELRQSREKLRSLAVELQIAEEQQRRQLAGDLHDSVGQLLAFSVREMQSLQKSASKKIAGSLQEIIRQLHTAIEQTRSLSFDLSPSILYDLGFEVAVEDLTDQFTKKQKVRCRFENCDSPKPLADPVKVMLYRSVRELLINIAKHAEAKTANVVLKRIGDDLHIRVEDDGRGCRIAKDAKSDGFGLFSIRERLHHFGGRFALDSEMGKGTAVTLVVPLSTEKERRKE